MKFSHASIVENIPEDTNPMKGFLTCKYQSLGCDFIVPNVKDHEVHECSYRPTRCPSLTCMGGYIRFHTSPIYFNSS